MYIDPVTLNWILMAAGSFCAGMIGYHIAWRKNETMIANTIDYLVNEGFLKSSENADGELELIKIHDGIKNGQVSSQDDSTEA